jgi:hypothetical protein
MIQKLNEAKEQANLYMLMNRIQSKFKYFI